MPCGAVQLVLCTDRHVLGLPHTFCFHSCEQSFQGNSTCSLHLAVCASSTGTAQARNFLLCNSLYNHLDWTIFFKRIESGLQEVVGDQLSSFISHGVQIYAHTFASDMQGGACKGELIGRQDTLTLSFNPVGFFCKRFG